MPKYSIIALLFFLFGYMSVVAQTIEKPVLVVKDTLKSNDINPLAPAKAAFFSAILPGLGQAYNKKYWKIPLVYAALGTSLYNYKISIDKYQEFRNAYKERLAGIENPNYSYLDNDRMLAAQKFYERNRDLSLFFTIVIYVLNIIDANVDAHLGQFNVNENLTFNTQFDPNFVNYKPTVGVALNYKF